ncbi:hypothetical protein CU669_18670 [Paramagnetospirillum kuznetsovii]|uniref:Laminin G domain-containing protein n=1 Tax=Paramagnetospirillum kuznetsovii TaxID=2053833 RepID=A0A364NU57_9PROT|nr:LamG-like jellyroll fold domain-containing protein [Paramagnetospirillum kuznetsovii]RAU20407.1 hypothetical protein CU669_18670 [Paramagnetospirillum kuznetsovii]
MDVSAASQPISVTGGTGNDTFTGGTGYDHFDGGAGTDKAIFHGAKGDYKIGAMGGGTITVQDTNSSDGDDGTDYLTHVETLQFSDGSLTVSSAPAAASFAVGAASQVNAFDSGAQDYIYLAPLADGGWISTWRTQGQDNVDGDWGSIAQRFDSTGAKVGSEFVVNQTLPGEQWGAQFSQLSDGRIVAAWHSLNQDGSSFGVYGRIYPATWPTSGSAGNEFLVNTTTNGYQAWPVVTATHDGGFFVAWDGNGGGNGTTRTIDGQIYNSSGTKVGSQISIASGAREPTAGAVTLSDGTVVVSWAGTDASGAGVFAQRINPTTGALVGGVISVNNLTDGDQFAPIITALAGGGFAAVWHDSVNDGNNFGIYARVFDSAGSAVTSGFLVNTATTSGWQAWPTITALAGGGFMAVWDDYSSGSFVVKAQSYGATGQPVGGVLTLSSASDIEHKPTATTLANGDVVVNFLQNGTSGQDIFTQRLTFTTSTDTTLTGTGTADVINVGYGIAIVDAGSGNDTIKVSGADLITMTSVIGGSGTDQVIVSNVGNITDSVAGIFSGVETLTLTGSTPSSVTFGALGRYNGVNTIDASATTGYMTVETSANFNGVTLAAGSGQTNFNAGAGIDVVKALSTESAAVFSAYTSGSVNVGFTGGMAGASMTLSGVDSIVFSDGKTVSLDTSNGSTTVIGGSGADVLHAGYGVVLDAGTGGDDTLIGYASGSTTFKLHNGLTSADTVTGGAGYDNLVLDGGTVADSAFSHVTGVETVSLVGAGTLTLGSIANGSAGIVTIDGSGSSGKLVINTVADASVTTIVGGGGNDTISAGTGGDTVTGGAGADTFVIAVNAGTVGSPMVIADFESGTDKLDLSAAGSTLDFVYRSWSGTLSATVATLTGLTNPTAVFMHDTTDGWLVFKNGAMDGTVIQLTGATGGILGSDMVGPTVTVLNHAPVFTGTSLLQTDINTPLYGSAVATDSDGDTLTYSLTGDSSNIIYSVSSATLSFGTLTVNGTALTSGGTFTQAQIAQGQVKYVAGSTTGTDYITTSIWDGVGGTGTANLYMHVFSGTDHAPTISTASALSVNQGGYVSVLSTGLIASDAETATPVFMQPNQLVYTITALPTHGAVTINGVVASVGSQFTGYDLYATQNVKNGVTYINDGQSSANDSFAVTVSDGQLTSGTSTISISTTAVNQAPVAGNGEGYVLSFDGENTAGFSVADTSKALAFTNAMTLEAWILPEWVGSGERVHTVMARGMTAIKTDYALEITEGVDPGTFFITPVLDGQALTSRAAAVTFTNAAWHNVAVSFNSANGVAVTYIDGVAADTFDFDPGALPVSSGAIFDIGESPNNPDSHFKGLMDELRVWNGVRTEAQISAGMTGELNVFNEPALVANWRFDEGSGTTVKDASLHQLDGVLGTGGEYVISDRAAITPTLDAAGHGQLTGSDPEGHALTYSLLYEPGHGTITLDQATGAFTYTPNYGYGGSDLITYTVSDGTLTSTPAMARLQAPHGNHAPLLEGLATRNSALALDGDTGSATAFLGTGKFTIDGAATFECDVNVSSLGARQDFIRLFSHGSNSVGLSFGVDTTGHLYVNNGYSEPNPPYSPVHIGNATISTDVWHHVAVTIDDNLSTGLSTATFVVDGMVYGGITYDVDYALMQSLDSVSIGDQGNSVLNGMIDNVRVWNTIRTLPELVGGAGATYTGAESGLVGAWTFDPVNGNSLTDLTGQHPLTLSGSAHLALPPAEALEFAGSTSVTSGNVFALSEHTVEAWIRTSDMTGYGTIFTVGSDPDTSATLNLCAGGLLQVRIGTGTEEYNLWETTAVIADGQWHHVAYSYSYDDIDSLPTIRVFIDGELATAPVVHTSGNAPPRLQLAAASATFGTDFVGDITDVRLWEAPRTDAQIAADMNHGLTGTEPGLLDNWTISGGTVVDTTGHESGVVITGDLYQSIHMQPDAATATLTTREGVALNGHVVGFDQDGGTLTYGTVTGGLPHSGTLHVQSDGVFSYTPDLGFYGSDTFSVQVTDAENHTTTKSFTVNVTDNTSVAGVAERTGVLITNGVGTAASASINSQDFATNQATVEFDFYLPQTTGKGAQRLLSFRDYDNSGTLLNVQVNDDGYLVVGTSSAVGSGSAQPTAGAWHHVAVTYSSNTATIYLDGVASGSKGGTSSTMTNASKLFVGPDSGNSDSSLTAMIDNVKLWNVAQSAEQVTHPSNYTTSDNLIGHWTFNDAASTSANLVGDNYSDMVLGAHAHLAAPPDRSAHFDTGQIAVVADNAIPVTGDLTLEAWVRWDGKTSTTNDHPQFIAYNGDPSWSGYGIYLEESTGKIGFMCGGAQMGASTTAGLTVGMWQHVALVHANNVWHLSVDGVDYDLPYNTMGIGDFGTHPGNMVIGAAGTNGGEGFHGDIADVRLWSTALDAGRLIDVASTDVPATAPHLVGYWKLDEGTGLVAHDQTGAHDATYSHSGTALVLDGETGAVHAKGIDLSNHNFTIEFWANRKTSSTEDNAISMGTHGYGGEGLHIDFQPASYSNDVIFSFWGNDLTFTDTTDNVGQWVHWAASYDADTNAMTLYKNGTQVATRTSEFDFTGGGDFQIGDKFDATGDSHFDGQIDDVRVWDVTRTGAQIAANYQQVLTGDQGGSLVAHYTFDSDLGALAVDSAGTAQNGTLLGGATRASTWVDDNHADVRSGGIQNAALTFAGGQAASAGNIFNIASGAFTMEAWVNPASLTGTQMLIAKDSSAGDGFALELVAGVPTFHIGSTTISGTTALSLGNWSHVAVTRFEDGLMLMVDGQPVQVVAAPDLDIVNAYDLMVGARAGASGIGLDSTTFHGQIAGVRLYADSLSPDEIATNRYLSTVDDNSLVAAWKGNSLSDASGNSHSLTLNGATLSGTPFRAMHFDGADRIVTSGSGVSFTNHTMEAMVRSTDTTHDYQGIVSTDGGGTYATMFMRANGSIRIEMNQADGSHDLEVQTTGIALNDGLWHNVAYSFVAATNTVHIYVDGVDVSTTVVANTLTANSFNASAKQMVIGGDRIDGGQKFIGDIADVRLWDRVLAGSEIVANKDGPIDGNPGDLLGMWRLDSVTGTTVFDATGAGNDGTISGSATLIDSAIPISGAVIELDRGSSYHGVLAADSSTGAALSYGIEAKPLHGSVVFNPDGSFAYTPTSGYVGVDSFVVKVNDGLGDTYKSVKLEVKDTTSVLGVSQHEAALTFNGSQGVAVSSNSAFAALGMSDFTVETLINPASLTGTQAVFIIGGGLPYFNLRIISGQLTFQMVTAGDSLTLQAPSTLTAGQWAHVAISHQGDSFTLYVDGNAVATASHHFTDAAPTSGSMGIGSLFKGSMDEIRVWDHARTASEIADNAHSQLDYEKGLIGYWNGADAGGNVVEDRSHNGHSIDLSAANAPHLVEPPSRGLHFDGSSSVVTSASLSLASHTVQAWIRTTNAAPGWDGAIFSSQSDGSNTIPWIQLAVSEGKLVAEMYGVSPVRGASYIGTTNIADGVWHNVAYTADPSTNTITLYVDGVAESASLFLSQNTGSISGLSVNAPAQIGTMRDDYAKFTGDIADVRVWGTVLNSAQIQNGMSTELTGSEPGLVANWHLDTAANAGGTVVDVATTPHNGTVIDTTSLTASVTGTLTSVSTGLAAGQPQGAMHFDGSSSATTSDNLVLTSHTVQAWIKSSSTANFSAILTAGNSGTSGAQVQIIVAFGVLRVDVVDNWGTGCVKRYIGSTTVADGQWHNVAYSLDVGTNALKLFVDGVQESISVDVLNGDLSAFSLEHSATIGAHSLRDGSTNFSGDIADIQIWNSALATSQIQYNMAHQPTGGETGLVANWQLDEASNATSLVNATSGVAAVSNDAPIYDNVLTADYGAPYHGHLAAESSTSTSETWSATGLTSGSLTSHGTLIIASDGTFTYTPNAGWHGLDKFFVQATGSDGFVTTKTIGVEVASPVEPIGVGAAGGNLQFNGSQYAQASGVGMASQSFSFEFWGNRAVTSASAQTALYQSGGMSVGYTDATHFGFTLNGYTVSVTPVPAVNTWTHWAGSYDSVSHVLSLYQNGVLVGTATGPTSFTGAATLSVGAQGSGGYGFNGQLDEIRLFSDVRSAAEVVDDYRRRDLESDDHLMVQWSMDRMQDGVSGSNVNSFVPDSSGGGLSLSFVGRAGAGNTIHDITGAGHNGTTLSGDTLGVISGHAAVHLEGSGAVGGITLASPNTLTTGTGAVTYGAWIRTTMSNATRGEILEVGATGLYQTAIFCVNEGHLYFGGNNIVGVSSSAYVNDGQWHYVAATYNAGYVSLYVDGKSDGAGYTYSNLTSNLQVLDVQSGGAAVIGDLADHWTDGYTFTGDISDVAVWSTTLSQASIQSAAANGAASVSTGSLLGNWTMGEAAASQPLFANTAGKALHFNGTSDHIGFTNSTLSAHPATEFTAEAWIRTSSASNETILSLGSTTGTGTGIKIYMNAGQLGFSIQGGTNAATPSGTTYNDGLFHHVALTISSGGVATVYVDGNVVATLSGATALNIATGTGQIGQTLTGTNFFSGDLSDVRLWNYARTAAEIANNMNNRLSGQESGLLDNWRLDDVAGTAVADTTNLGAGTSANSLSSFSVKPSVYDDIITTREDTVARGGLLSIDHDNAAQALTVSLQQQAAHGTVTITTSGSGPSYVYTPNAHYVGSDSFIVGVNDGSGFLTYATIGVNVRAAHEAPQVSGLGAFTTDSSGSHVLNFQVSDPIGLAGHQLFEVVLSAGHGFFQLGQTGGLNIIGGANGSNAVTVVGTLDRINAALKTATYSADPGFNGVGGDTVNFQVFDYSVDNSGKELATSSSMAVTIGNRAPSGVLTMTNASAVAGGALTGTLSGTDPEGTAFGWGMTGPDHGSLTLGTASFTYTPTNSTYTGSEILHFTESDGTNTVDRYQRVELYNHQTNATTAITSDTSGLVAMSGVTITHSSGSHEIAGLSLTAASALNLTGGNITIDVGASIGASSSLAINGGTLTLGTNALAKSAGALSLSSGTLTGAGTLQQTGGTIALRGFDNDIGVAFQNAAAALLLVEGISGSAAVAIMEHGFDNLGVLQLNAAVGGTYTDTAWLRVEGALTNHGTIMSTGQVASSSHGLMADSFDNVNLMQVDHSLYLTAATITNHGVLTLGDASTYLVMQDNSTGHAAASNVGLISGDGTLYVSDADFVNHGYINPGSSTTAGTLAIGGDLTLAGDSHLVLDTGLTGGSDKLDISGVANLGGDLYISNHATPTGSYSLMTWESSTGGFESIHGLDNGPTNAGWLLDPTFSGTGLNLTVRSATGIGQNDYFSDITLTANYLIGLGGNEEVHLGGGADVFIGHGGNNVIGVGGATNGSGTTFHFLDGGSGGNNQLLWEGISNTNDTFDLTKLQTNALQNFDVLNFANSNTGAKLDLAHVLAMTNGANSITGTANTLVVIGSGSGNSSSNYVSFAENGWHVDGQADLTVNNKHDSYTQYSNGDAHVLVENNVHVG